MPPTNSNPNFQKGDVPSAATWDSVLGSKVDAQSGQMDSPQITGTIIATTLSTSTSYADDTAAAAGGVPVGGVYRNGNFVMIRLT